MAFILMVALALALSTANCAKLPFIQGESLVNSILADDALDYRSTVIEYWTEERMASALPPHMDTAESGQRVARTLVGDKGEKYVPGGNRDFIRRNVGLLYFKDLVGRDRVCTATAVNTESKSLILTAGHCTFTGGSEGRYFSHVLFVVKAVSGTNDLKFVGKSAIVHDTYKQLGLAYLDIGLIVVDKANGQTVADDNSPKIVIHETVGADAAYFGFPLVLDEEEKQLEDLYVCKGPSKFWSNDYEPNIHFANIQSNFYASGAPIFHGVRGDGASAQLVAITTIKEDIYPHGQNGPTFMSEFQEILDKVKN